MEGEAAQISTAYENLSREHLKTNLVGDTRQRVDTVRLLFCLGEYRVSAHTQPMHAGLQGEYRVSALAINLHH
jgi:hypothetical protein